MFKDRLQLTCVEEVFNIRSPSYAKTSLRLYVFIKTMNGVLRLVKNENANLFHIRVLED